MLFINFGQAYQYKKGIFCVLMQNIEAFNAILKNKECIKLFTLKEGIPVNLLSPFMQVDYPAYEWVHQPATADYFVFAVNYEVTHDPTNEYAKWLLSHSAEKKLILQYEAELMRLAKQYNKKLLIIYYNDSAADIKINNALIFRTSIVKSDGRKNEFTIPVLKNDLSLLANNYPEFVEWKEIPSIGFRGQASPLNLKTSRALRNEVNLLANRLNQKNIFAINKNFGYLERRNALQFLQKSSIVENDFFITQESDIDNAHSTKLFCDAIFKNPYTLCVSGFGNYSYRLYEVLSAGRIPVFVDTDCKLPFEEFINWRDYVVWVDRKNIPYIDDIILHYHQSKKGNEFILQQKKNKELWMDYLSPQKFFAKITAYL